MYNPEENIVNVKDILHTARFLAIIILVVVCYNYFIGKETILVDSLFTGIAISIYDRQKKR